MALMMSSFSIQSNVHKLDRLERINWVIVGERKQERGKVWIKEDIKREIVAEEENLADEGEEETVDTRHRQTDR